MLYSLPEAAKFLNIPDSGMDVLVKLNWLRPCILVPRQESLYIVDEDEITLDDLDNPNNMASVVENFGIEAPEFLYIQSFLFVPEVQLPQIVTNSYETFDGEEVQLFNRLGIPRVAKYGSPEKVIRQAKFSAEELNRYQSNRVHQQFEFKHRTDHKPFSLPDRIDSAAEAIVSLGNKYHLEKGMVPNTPGMLRRYMIENAGDPWEVIDRPNNMRQRIQIEGHPMSYESFGKRYKKYLEDNGG